MGLVCIVIFLPFAFEEFSAEDLIEEEAKAALQKKESDGQQTKFGHKKLIRQQPKLVRQYSTVSIIDGRFMASSSANNKQHIKSFWSKLKIISIL